MKVFIYCRLPIFHSFSLLSLLSGGTAMVAMLKPTRLPLFFVAGIILSSFFITGYGFKASSLPSSGKERNHEETQPEGLSWMKSWTWRSKKNRRLMIGSTAPTCSYNECRSCRFSCSAEQVPVDANDPINSAYHYRCVCHRRE